MGHNQVVMVTGAAQGIGRATAEKFLAHGWNVVAIDQQAEGLASLQSAMPNRVATLVLDVTGQDAPAEAMALVKQRFGRLDALINNAGIGKSKAVHETTDAELDRFYAINLRSVFRFSREALGLMEAGACMVHVASTFGLVGNPVASSYAATKAAPHEHHHRLGGGCRRQQRSDEIIGDASFVPDQSAEAADYSVIGIDQRKGQERQHEP
jgi:NAD(P)-dependent dehydrogenase (short-subunit alcohol dehydrogenase family)